MFCSTLLYVDSSIAIILMGKRELGASLNLSIILGKAKDVFLVMRDYYICIYECDICI